MKKKMSYIQSDHKAINGLPSWKWLWYEENNERLFTEDNNFQRTILWV